MNHEEQMKNIQLEIDSLPEGYISPFVLASIAKTSKANVSKYISKGYITDYITIITIYGGKYIYRYGINPEEAITVYKVMNKIYE